MFFSFQNKWIYPDCSTGMMAQGSQEDIRGDNIVKKTEAPGKIPRKK